MEERFAEVAAVIALGVEVIAVLIVGIGALDAVFRIGLALTQKGTEHRRWKAVWRRFGVWLVLGLEFELAADIVRSVIAPSWQEIGQLAAIAAIRTFLNFFLEKDLEQTAEEPETARPIEA